jgi:uncharacterized membrane protein
VLDQLINAPFAKEIITVITAMLPVFELRLSIPIAINSFNMPWYEAYALAVAGNLLPVPLLLLFFQSMARLASKIPAGKRFIDWLMNLSASRSQMVEKYKELGLFIFVSIPLPVTGAWTASLISIILGFKFRTSLFFISMGVLSAGVTVTILSLLGWIGAVIAGTAIALLAAIAILRKRG